ncbi:hypothetical protein CIB48_g5808 [Xylaria polymorpha]|nr:hypothetical protein CIB48_g5808 [Xylaria polymorpha]
MTKRRLREGLSRGFARTNRKVSSRMQLPDWARVPQLRGLAHALTPVAPPVGHERLELGGGLTGVVQSPPARQTPQKLPQLPERLD